MNETPKTKSGEANDLLGKRRRPDAARKRSDTVLKLEAHKQKVLAEVLRSISPLAWSIAPGAQIHGRIKSVESLLSKMRSAGLGIDDVLDSIGVRVIVRNEKECYGLIQRIHRRFKTIVGQYDDYIRSPKPNGYRSLHTTILASNEYPVEVQVRTQRMHVSSERGAAAHSVYKRGPRLTEMQQVEDSPRVGWSPRSAPSHIFQNREAS
ncbi:hypothetical protein ACFL6C_03725 [Myxococcota bacterium]